LREEVTASREERRLSMRETRRCPSCGGTKVAHSRSIRTPDGMGGALELGLALKLSVWTFPKAVAPFEAYACSSCGLVEWYVRSFESVDAKDESITLVEPDPTRQGPYR